MTGELLLVNELFKVLTNSLPYVKCNFYYENAFSEYNILKFKCV